MVNFQSRDIRKKLAINTILMVIIGQINKAKIQNTKSGIRFLDVQMTPLLKEIKKSAKFLVILLD